MAKVVIYLRCSTHGHELVGVYSGNESTWRNGHRKELARLFGNLRKRRVDIRLVWSLDRLTKEGIAKVFELTNKFKQAASKLSHIRSLERSNQT